MHRPEHHNQRPHGQGSPDGSPAPLAERLPSDESEHERGDGGQSRGIDGREEEGGSWGLEWWGKVRWPGGKKSAGEVNATPECAQNKADERVYNSYMTFPEGLQCA